MEKLSLTELYLLRLIDFFKSMTAEQMRFWIRDCDPVYTAKQLVKSKHLRNPPMDVPGAPNHRDPNVFYVTDKGKQAIKDHKSENRIIWMNRIVSYIIGVASGVTVSLIISALL